MCGGVDGFRQRAQLHTGRGQGLDRVDDARQAAFEPIERDHEDDIALTGLIEKRSQTGPIVTGPPTLVGGDELEGVTS